MSSAPIGDKLAQGYAQCRSITRTHGTTYYWGARLLPKERRRHVFAVYALARLADDIVDHTEGQPIDVTTAALDRFESNFWTAVQLGDSEDAVLAAIVCSVRECGIEPERFARFFAAMRQDLTCRTYPTYADLLAYMDGSAAVIGEMMLPVLQPSSSSAVGPARALGFAFQLTNFLRDVGEDLDRGRVYLPQEDLDRSGADPWTRRVTPQWRELMTFEIARNEKLYDEADAGLAMLSGASARCVTTARVLYSRILRYIEANDYDVFSLRARVPTSRRVLVAAGALVRRP